MISPELAIAQDLHCRSASASRVSHAHQAGLSQGSREVRICMGYQGNAAAILGMAHGIGAHDQKTMFRNHERVSPNKIRECLQPCP